MLGVETMKKIVILSCLLSPLSFASQTLFNPIVSSTSTSSSVSNPASDYLTSNQDITGLVLIEPLAIGYELGDVNSFIDQIDDLQDILENGVSSTAEANAAEEKFDTFLKNAGEDGFVKVSGSGSLVVFPSLYTNQREGVFTFDFNYGGMTKLGLLDDPDGVEVTGTNLTTDSGIYEQYVTIKNFALGYRETLWTNGYSELLIGSRINLNEMRFLRRFSTIEYQGEDEIEGEATSTNIGIDVGVLWAINSFSLGVTVNNINEPKYDLGDLTCDASSASGFFDENCDAFTNLSATGDVDFTGRYVAERQAKVDFFLSSPGNALNIQGSYDINGITDATGDEYQWAEIALSYLSDSFFVPGLRVGYKKNLIGSELSYINAGYTFFKYLNFDSGMSLDTVSYDGANYPRSLYANLGLALAF